MINSLYKTALGNVLSDKCGSFGHIMFESEVRCKLTT